MPRSTKKRERDPSELGAGVSVSRGMNDMVVRVLANQYVTSGGKHYEDGDEVQLSGPDAMALAQGGFVEVVRSIENDG